MLADKNKLRLTKDDLFDKIINLKLTVKKSGGKETEEFIIRSDYEAVFKNQSVQKALSLGAFTDGAYYIRKCQYKPSIKFTYTRVSADTNIAMDLYITNFLIFSSDGRVMATFNRADYDLIKVEVMMGYWGQFKDMPHATLEDLYKFEPMFGADKISMNYVDYVTTDSLPPDYVLHIHGFVSNPIEKPADAEEKQPETFDEAMSSEDMVETPAEEAPVTPTSKSDLEFIFEQLITNKFKRSPTDLLSSKPYSFQSVDNISAQTQLGVGVRVFLTDEVKAIKIKGLRDKDGNMVLRKTYYKSGDSVDKAITRIIQHFAPRKGLTPQLLNDGNFLIFLKKETEDVDKLAKSVKKSKTVKNKKVQPTVFETIYDNKLPAVYNINVNATATIVCPFFAFVNPFDTVQFEYRYHTSNIVTYYASIGTDRTTFIATNIQVSFATTENVNEMQIYCITSTSKEKK